MVSRAGEIMANKVSSLLLLPPLVVIFRKVKGHSKLQVAACPCWASVINMAMQHGDVSSLPGEVLEINKQLTSLVSNFLILSKPPTINMVINMVM